MKLVGIREARAVLGDLVREARDGEAIVLTQSGAPSVLLVPIDAADLTVAPAFVRQLLDAARDKTSDRRTR